MSELGQLQSSGRTWVMLIARILLPLPAIGILTLAVPRLVAGVVREAAFTANMALEVDYRLKRSDYRKAAWVLSHAPSADGETQIAGAEAAANGGAKTSEIVPLVENALAEAPADARGWILLARLLAEQNPKHAAAALSLATEMAPNDYYLVARRAIVGASLWDYLSQDVRNKLLDDARLLATDPSLRSHLIVLLSSPGGQNLVDQMLTHDASKPHDPR